MTPVEEFALLHDSIEVAEKVLALSAEDNVTPEQRAAMEDAGDHLKAAYTVAKRAVSAIRGVGTKGNIGVHVGERYERQGRTCLVLGIIERTVVYRFKGEPMCLAYYTAFLSRHKLSQGI